MSYEQQTILADAPRKDDVTRDEAEEWFNAKTKECQIFWHDRFDEDQTLGGGLEERPEELERFVSDDYRLISGFANAQPETRERAIRSQQSPGSWCPGGESVPYRAALSVGGGLLRRGSWVTAALLCPSIDAVYTTLYRLWRADWQVFFRKDDVVLCHRDG